MGHKPWDLPWRRAERRRAKQAWKDDTGREVRTYGSDVGNGVEAIVEATLMDDGTWHHTAVVLDDSVPGAELRPDP